LLSIDASGERIDHPKLPGGIDVRYVLAGVFLQTADATSMLVVLRAEPDGPFGEMEASVLRGLMPHLRQAALLIGELSSLRSRLASFTTYLDRSVFPFLLTDARGRVLYGNSAAKQATGSKDGIAIASGQLTLTSQRSRAAFAKIIENVATGRGGSFCRVEVGRPSDKPPYRVLLMSVPSSEGLPRGLSQPAAIVLIVDTDARFELDAEVLEDVFSLTPAEARVTGKLGAGQSAEEIADEMGVSLQTVRTHIRRVLVKTATGRQGELIALILRTAPFCRI
jgi:DNA-binding CsgD family transcriptional regulator